MPEGGLGAQSALGLWRGWVHSRVGNKTRSPEWDSRIVGSFKCWMLGVYTFSLF